MTGYIRLLLAITVLLSHVDIRVYGLNPGVIAVVIFYMLAGSVVSHIWSDILTDGPGRLMRFYKDRCLRIFPLYLYTAILTLTFLLFTAYGNPEYKLPALLNNVFIIPLNYYMYIDSTVMTQPAWNLIPPAWSLGAELQAYLLLPFALQFKHLRILLISVSVAVYLLANIAYINADYFGYRLLPGVFFIFLLGSSFRQQQAKSYRILLAVIVFVLINATIVHVKAMPAPVSGYVWETLSGLVIGTIVLTLTNKTKIKLPFNQFVGSVSYGVFLNHFVVIWMLDYSKLIDRNSTLYYITIIAITAVISAFGAYLIDQRLAGIRYKIICKVK